MVQDGSFSLDRQRDYLRRLALKAAGPLFPARIVADHGGLQQAEALARSGRGIVLIMNHFSKRDAFQVLRLVYANDVLRRRATLAPVAAHRAGPAVYALANLFSVELCPVVTPEAAALYGVDPATGRHALAYARQAVETLRAGGIVPLAAQAGRRASLEKPRMRPVSLLLAQARRKRVSNVALFFVGLGIRGERGYALEDVGGMNLMRRYEVGIGKAYAMEEALALAGGLRQLEEWVFAQLQSLVPAAYRGPTAQPEGAV